MAIFKCKICGGSLDIDKSSSVATCEYCGTKQTLPKFDDERRANLYDRANHFRRNNDFDKAMGIYEVILNEDNTDAEAYWSIILCRYGIEYVKDPVTHKHIPTVNRAQFTSIFDDEDYKAAIANADTYQREIYEADANAINKIQKEFLAISQKEEPFDVFICYKETDQNGERTKDSVIATELYSALSDEGLKVFFSRITLEDKLGTAYEPYIFAALQSAKVMVVLGTDSRNFNSPWVKNEWSRYLALIQKGAKKTLIPAYRDMDPYDLPDEFSHLQAQDMAKIGFMQDLVRGIKKIIGFESKKSAVVKETVITSEKIAVEPLFKRASMALADGEFGRADAFYEQILNQEPENANAYLGKLLAELRIKSKSDLNSVNKSFENSNNYKKAIQFANEELKNELSSALEEVIAKINDKKMNGIYQGAKAVMQNARDIPTCKRAKKFFVSISGYKDADDCALLCQEKIDALQREWDQQRAEQQKRLKKLKRARVGALLISSLLLILVVGLSVGSILFFKVFMPNSKRNDAFVIAGQQRYDEALALLNEAKSEAWFDKTISDIDNSISIIQMAKDNQQLVNETLKKLNSNSKEADYKTAINKLLGAGITTNVSYQCEGGALINNTAGTNEISYAPNSQFWGFLKAERSGYNFKSWSCEQMEYQPLQGSCIFVFKAIWEEHLYSIKYKTDASVAYKTILYSIEDNDFSLPIPKKDGYTFIGWSGDDLDELTIDVVIPKGSHGDRFYTANWEVNGYTVTFDCAGGECSVDKATYTYDTIVDLPVPKREGYTFAGWYNGGLFVSDGAWKVNIRSNVTLKAVWDPIDYKITYDLGNVSSENSNPTGYSANSDTVVLKDMYNEYATFMGWYTDKDFTNRITTIPKGSVGDLTLYAKWDFQVFTIEYDWNGGDAVSNAKTTFTVADLPITLCKPTKAGHSFYYWALEDIDGEPIKSIEECKNYKLVANYIINGLKIEILNGGGFYECGYGDWGYAYYDGDATEITIPKYHNVRDICDTPNIIQVRISSPNLKKLYISDEVLDVILGTGDDFEFNEYENGLYLGRPDKPYTYLFGRKNASLSIKNIHEDTVAISTGAFQNDLKLTSLVIPKTVKYIEDYAFRGCYNIREVYNLSSFDISTALSMASYRREIYTTLDKPSQVFEYGDYIVYYDAQKNLYELLVYTGNNIDVVLPNNINGSKYMLGSYFFYKRTDIKSIVFSENIVSIGENAFYGCTGLINVDFSQSTITSIGNSAFYGCSSLERVNLPESVTFIGETTFRDCSSLIEITLSQSCTEIGFSAFWGCVSLRSIVLPSTLEMIRPNAFMSCRSLLEIYNLSSCDISNACSYAKVVHTSLDEPSCWIEQDGYLFFVSEENDLYLLCGYSGDESVLTLPESINGHSYSIYDYAFMGNTNITELTVSDGVLGIGKQAFASCTNLSKVYIGKDVSIIGENAFSSCSALISAEFADVEGWGMYHSSSLEKEYTASEIENVENAVTVLKTIENYDSLRKK